MVARTFSSVPLAGSGRQARYSSTLLTAPIRPTDVPSLPIITFLIRKGLSQSEIESPAEFYRFIQSAIATRAPQNTTAATQNPNRPPRRCRTPPAAAISSDRNRKSSRVLSVHPERDCNQSPAKHHRRHPESQPAAAPLPHPAGSRNQFQQVVILPAQNSHGLCPGFVLLFSSVTRAHPDTANQLAHVLFVFSGIVVALKSVLHIRNVGQCPTLFGGIKHLSLHFRQRSEEGRVWKKYVFW